MAYSFNKDYVKSISKERFIREMKPHFPNLDLEREYDKIAPKKAKKAKKKEDESDISPRS